jgi:hypothetical protein
MLSLNRLLCVVAKPDVNEQKDVIANDVKNDTSNVNKSTSVKLKPNKIQKENTNKSPAYKIPQNDQTNKTKVKTVNSKQNIINSKKKIQKIR